MSDERRERIDDLLLEAAALAPDQREEFVRAACGADQELRAEVHSLLAHVERPLAFLDGSAIELRSAADSGAEAAADPLLGCRVGAYRLDELVGVGGMGSVYRASRQDGLLQHEVAIKVLNRRAGLVASHDRFQLEWQTLAKLGHPNIARLLDAGHTPDGMPYLVMEYVDGAPIDAWCDEHWLSLVERIRLVEVVARTVEFAHQNLIVHRDLKPANILVTAGGVPKLLDFGIAKILDPNTAAAGAPVTVEWARAMTPDYASPEQVRGDPVSTASDVYPLGVVLYELLTGRRPFPPTPQALDAIQRLACDAEPVRPSDAVSPDDTAAATCRRTTPRRLQRQLRGDLDNIVMMALRKDPRRRYASAAQLADDLRRHLAGHPVLARPDTVGYRLRKFARRNRLAVGAATALALVVGAGTGTTVWQARRAAEQAAQALTEAESAQQMTDFLVDSVLVSARRREPEELAAIRGMIERQAVTVRQRYATQAGLRANLTDALGRACMSCGLHDEARGLIEEAAAAREAAFGPRSLAFARSLDSRGQLAYAHGKYDVAVEHFTGALALQREQPAGVHRDIARAANNLGVALRKLGRLDEAEALHVEALERRRASLGDRDLLVAESLNNLGAIHVARGQYERAKGPQREVLAIRRASLGDLHPLVAEALNNLATVESHCGDFAAAAALLEDAVQAYRALSGGDPRGLARTLTNLAAVRRELGGLDAARAAAAEALEGLRKLLGDDHPDVAGSLLVLADLDAASGWLDAALKRSGEAIAIYRASYPEGHERIGTAANARGKLLLQGGQPVEAEPLLVEAHRILTAARPNDARFTVAPAVNLARCLGELKRFDEAEPLLRTALQRLSAPGADAATLAAVKDQLRKCYRDWGKPDLARALQ